MCLMSTGDMFDVFDVDINDTYFGNRVLERGQLHRLWGDIDDYVRIPGTFSSQKTLYDHEQHLNIKNISCATSNTSQNTS